jgi:hypothetical protein
MNNFLSFFSNTQIIIVIIGCIGIGIIICFCLVSYAFELFETEENEAINERASKCAAHDGMEAM